MPLWRCPICDRRFAKPNQAHSCRPVSVDSHFEGKINLIPKHHMGGIRVLSQRLEVGFVLSRRIEHPRVRRAIEVGPSTYAQAVALAGHDDLDPELLGWLREAYERSARGWPFASHRVREHSQIDAGGEYDQRPDLVAVQTSREGGLEHRRPLRIDAGAAGIRVLARSAANGPFGSVTLPVTR